MKNSLSKLRLNQNNSVVIGSGILQALSIRKSHDIDVVVNQETFDSLKATGNFKVTENHGREILADDIFEIGTSWNVLDKMYQLKDLLSESTMIDSVNYVNLEFLYKVKKSWASQENPRQKDVDDVLLIESYLKSGEKD